MWRILHQRLAPDDVHDSCQIIGQDRESHLGGYFWKRFGEEVCRSHAGLHRAERMLDCLATQAHGLWVCIKALLHSLEQMLMLPSRDAAFFACGALIFDCAGLAGIRPVAAHLLPVFLVGIVEFELLAS